MMPARRSRTLRIATNVATCAAVLAACGGSSGFRTSTETRPLGDGESLGKIERLAGGTAVTSNVRTLLTLACQNGQLILRTNQEAISGEMDCSKQIPQAALDRFLAQPVVITYNGERLRLENPSAGTLNLTVKGATTSALRAAPDATP